MTCDQTEPLTAGECGPCSPARRNRYFRDKEMHVADYRIEQDYLINRRRLINRAMLGWGVVQGFKVRFENAALAVGRGVAFDPCGRELVACDEMRLRRAEDVLWLTQGQHGMSLCGPPSSPPAQPHGDDDGDGDDGNCRRPEHDHYLLCAHYAEQLIDEVRISDGCGAVKCEANHLCETVVYSLRQIDHCPRGPGSCLENIWNDHDGDPWEPDDDWESDGDRGPYHARVHDRGTHRQLVFWSEERLKHVDFCRPCGTEPVGRLCVDLDSFVPLACVRIGFNECDELYFLELENEWRPKRLARPNSVLFDLIRGCDLVRIEDVGWSKWLSPHHGVVPYEDFAKKFKKPKGNGKPSETEFWIRFSGPVQTSSLTFDTVVITALRRQTSEGLNKLRRIPVVGMVVDDPSQGDPEGTTRRCHVRVSRHFWFGEISNDDASDFDQENIIEIEVRTGFMFDVLGQEVAGGGRFVPTSGCTPGGRFLSSFIVGPRPRTVADDEGDIELSTDPVTPEEALK